MQVENSSAYTSPLFTRAAHGAENKGGEWASTPAPAQNGETDIANTAKAAPVTGVTGSNLSKEVVGQLIAEAQETQQSRNSIVAADHDSPKEIRKRYFRDIATDPEFAAEQAKILGTGQDGLLIPNDVFDDFRTSGRLPGKGYELNDPNNPVLKVQKQRTNFYEQEVAKGTPPAQIYADLLRFNLNLSDRYTEGDLDPTNSYSPGFYKSMQQQDLDMINTAISAAIFPTDAYDGILSEPERHGLESIANDPVYAASQAKLIGTSGEMYFIKELPTVNNGYSDAQRTAFLAKNKVQVAAIEAVQQQRTAYYENLTAQDLPPAEIYFKLLEFNANLPKSHDDTMEWSASRRAGGPSYSDYNQARSDYLQNLISQEKSASASAKDVDPVETT